MKDLLDEIINKNFDLAESLLKGHLASIVESKLNEKKKMCAAGMTDYPDLPKSVQKLRRGLTEDETEPPFVPDKEKSTDWKNPKAKAKQLARMAMKAQKEKASNKQSKEQVNEEKNDKPKQANMPSYGGKKSITRNVFRKTSDDDVRRRLEKEIEDAQEKEDKLDEASLKQAYTKAKKVLGHKKRVSDAAAKAMDSDSWQKNLANVTKVVKKND